jgi:hypothetical protein
MELIQKKGKTNFCTNALLASASKDSKLYYTEEEKGVLQSRVEEFFSLYDSLFPKNSLQQ